jgi:type I restriction enzyme S subunit
MASDLPPGWTTTTLGEICSKPQYGWTCKGAKNGQLKYVRTTDISGRYSEDDVKPPRKI